MLELIILTMMIPFLAGIVIASIQNFSEIKTGRIAFIGAVLYGVCVVVLATIWILNGQKTLSYDLGHIFDTPQYGFPLSLFVDSLSCLWLLMTGFLSNIIVQFSRVYLHKDPGFQRFFACLMFLIFGLTVLAVAGGLDTFIAGWEFVGICSFLLIGFYHQRGMSIRNAFKVYSVYRFCDAGLLLGAWLSHVLWHDSQSFMVLRSPEMQTHLSEVGQWSLLAMTALILLAAAGKSAQFPFSFWLSRAMEGPTPSSAIFYGALSVHAGLLLLFRTSAIWNASTVGPFLVGGLGVVTALAASGIARAQSNIKGQIAYSSAAHVGLMFVELALGWRWLAMIHMFGNASFRCYQLLVSPSSVADILRLQGSKSYRESMPKVRWLEWIPLRVRSTLYVFAMNDGFLESIVRKSIWHPMTSIGKILHKNTLFFTWAVCPSIWLASLLIGEDLLPVWHAAAVFAAIVCALGLTFLALAETESSLSAWNAVGMSNLLAATSVWSIDPHILKDLLVFGGGVIFFWIVGVQALLVLRGSARLLTLSRYQGLIKRHPGASFLLFIAVLGMSGFPISPAFVGQDMLLHHAVDDYTWLAVILALVFSVNGLALMRVYLKVCLGSEQVHQENFEFKPS